MQIRPITPVSYKNQNAQQNNNQQSFGMATTAAMDNFWAANRIRLLTCPHYSGEQVANIVRSMVDIELHPSTIVDYKNGALIISKKGQPDKTIKVESLTAIEEAAKEL